MKIKKLCILPRLKFLKEEIISLNKLLKKDIQMFKILLVIDIIVCFTFMFHYILWKYLLFSKKFNIDFLKTFIECDFDKVTREYLYQHRVFKLTL